jgi:hypothetical protein
VHEPHPSECRRFPTYHYSWIRLQCSPGKLPRPTRRSTDVQAQLFTVPPYAVALVFMLLLTSFSDWKQTRGIPVMSVFLVGIIGWAILLAVPVSPGGEEWNHC